MNKNDVDIGLTGIPLPPKSAGELFEVAVRINTDDEILVGAQLSVNFDDTYIKAVSAVVGSDWPSYFQETINYPSTSASILISNAESTVKGTAIEVAVITFEVVTDQAVVTELTVDVRSLIHKSDTTPSEVPFASPQ